MNEILQGDALTELCDIFDEVKRVLRKDGTCWVNLGDTYGGTGQHSEEHPEWRSKMIANERLKPYLEQQSVTNFMQIPIQNNEGDSTHD